MLPSLSTPTVETRVESTSEPDIPILTFIMFALIIIRGRQLILSNWFSGAMKSLGLSIGVDLSDICDKQEETK